MRKNHITRGYKELLEELLADICLYGKMNDKTEQMRARNWYQSAVFALRKLGMIYQSTKLSSEIWKSLLSQMNVSLAVL